jgi:hypothetical protein
MGPTPGRELRQPGRVALRRRYRKLAAARVSGVLICDMSFRDCVAEEWTGWRNSGARVPRKERLLGGQARLRPERTGPFASPQRSGPCCFRLGSQALVRRQDRGRNSQSRESPKGWQQGRRKAARPSYAGTVGCLHQGRQGIKIPTSTSFLPVSTKASAGSVDSPMNHYGWAVL